MRSCWAPLQTDFVKQPKDVVQVGQEVKTWVLETDGDKLRLTMVDPAAAQAAPAARSAPTGTGTGGAAPAEGAPRTLRKQATAGQPCYILA